MPGTIPSSLHTLALWNWYYYHHYHCQLHSTEQKQHLFLSWTYKKVRKLHKGQTEAETRLLTVRWSHGLPWGLSPSQELEKAVSWPTQRPYTVELKVRPLLKALPETWDFWGLRQCKNGLQSNPSIDQGALWGNML